MYSSKVYSIYEYKGDDYYWCNQKTIGSNLVVMYRTRDVIPKEIILTFEDEIIEIDDLTEESKKGKSEWSKVEDKMKSRRSRIDKKSQLTRKQFKFTEGKFKRGED